MIRIGQRELEVPVWMWAAVPFAFIALAIQEATRFGGIGTEPDIYYLHIVTHCAVASVAGFLLMDLMRRARTPWYGLPLLLMASFAASTLAIGWLNGAMRELMAVVVGAAITAAAGRGGTGAAGLLLMGITFGTPLVAGALLTLMFTLVSRFLAGLPLWSREARRDLWANLGAMLLWLADRLRRLHRDPLFIRSGAWIFQRRCAALAARRRRRCCRRAGHISPSRIGRARPPQ